MLGTSVVPVLRRWGQEDRSSRSSLVPSEFEASLGEREEAGRIGEKV